MNPPLQQHRTRHLVIVLLVLLIVVQAALYAINQYQTREQRVADTDSRLHTAAQVVERLLELRGWQQARQVATLASDYDLHEAVANGDKALTASLLRSHSRALHADLMLLNSLDRQSLVSLPADPAPADLAALLKTASSMTGAGSAVPIELLRSEAGRLYQLQHVSLNIPASNAELTLGFAIDDSLADELKQLTGSELVVLSRGENGAWQQHASTLALPQTALLGNPSALLADSEWTLQDGSRQYQMHSVRLRDVHLQQTGEVLLIVGQSRPLGLQPSDWREPLLHLLPLVAIVLALLAILLLQSRWTGFKPRPAKDSLTGLGTWPAFAGRIEQALSGSDNLDRPVALMLIRLEGLPRIADPRQVDALVRETALRLRGQLDRQHSLARLSQDTFALLLPGCDRAQAIRHAQGLEQDLGEPIAGPSGRLLPAISTGIAVAPQDATSADGLLNMAMTEMAAGQTVAVT